MASKNSERAQGPVCSQGPKIIYAWAMDAKSLRLPEGIPTIVSAYTVLYMRAYTIVHILQYVFANIIVHVHCTLYAAIHPHRNNL